MFKNYGICINEAKKFMDDEYKRTKENILKLHKDHLAELEATQKWANELRIQLDEMLETQRKRA